MGILIVVLPLAVLLLLFTISARKMVRSYKFEELPLVLRSVNLKQIEMLLDPAGEAIIRKSMSHSGFRNEQLSRLNMVMEQASRLSHNAALLGRWANQEYSTRLSSKNRAGFDSTDQAVLRIIQSANDIRRQTSLMTSKIIIWRMMLLTQISFLPVPRLSDLRELLGSDLLETYESLTGAAAHIGILYGSKEYEQLLAAL